jgi:hypothetical protein
MFRILLLALSLTIAAAELAAAGGSAEQLTFLPFDQVTAALRVVPSGLPAIARIPEGYLLQCTPGLVRRLASGGIRVEVLAPYREGEGLVLLPPVETTGILRRWEDHQLVRGGEGAWSLLAVAGVRVVPVDVAPLVVEDLRLHLSPSGVRYDSSIAAVLALVNDTTMREVVQSLQNFGTRYWNNANRDSVGRWVRNRFQSFGYTNVVLDSFQHNGTWQVNVVATLPGADTQDGELIVGGHHDSYSSNQLQAPGADDNATGTAASLEMARVLKLTGYSPNLTILFQTYGAEEAGLVGSRSYAQRARTAGRSIRAMQNYDMIGTRNAGQTDRDVYVVWYTGAEAVANLHAAMMRMYTTLTPVLTTSYRTGSDSYPFWQQNYASVFCIERDFSPYYHSPSDLLQYLDMPYARDIVRSGLAMLLHLDKTPPPVAGLRVWDQGNGTSVDVAWDSVQVPDLYRYRVYTGTMPGVYTTMDQQTGRTRTLTGLTPGTTYYIGVSIVDIVGVEGMILERSITPSTTPAAPAGLTVQGDSAGAVLTWRANRELDLLGYHVYHSPSGSGFERLTTSALPETTWSTGSPGGYYYVTAIDVSGFESAPSDTVQASTTGVEEGSAGLPGLLRIVGNYPNPFNPATVVAFEVGRSGPVNLEVHDLLGRRVGVLVDDHLEAGAHTVRWEADGRSSGVYFLVLRGAGSTSIRRIMLVR